MVDSPATDTPASDAPEAPETGTATEALPEGAATEEDPFAAGEVEPASFPRDYVEKLRREGAKYRTTAKEREAELEQLRPLGEAFAGWEPGQVEGWQTFLRTAQENPDAALAALIRDGFALDKDGATELLTSIFEEVGEPGAAPTTDTPAGDDLDRPLTLRDLEAREEAKQAQATQASALDQVYEEAKELGYNPKAEVGSLDEFRYQRLLHLAVNNHGNDLGKAHEALVAQEQAAVQQRVDTLASTAEGLPVPTGSGSAGAPAGGETDWEKSRVNAREFLAGVRASTT